MSSKDEGAAVPPQSKGSWTSFLRVDYSLLAHQNQLLLISATVNCVFQRRLIIPDRSSLHFEHNFFVRTDSPLINARANESWVGLNSLPTGLNTPQYSLRQHKNLIQQNGRCSSSNGSLPRWNNSIRAGVINWVAKRNHWILFLESSFLGDGRILPILV